MRTKTRPFVVSFLIILFVVGTVASSISVLSLSFPGSFLEPVWRLNPHAHEGFARMGGWSVVMMSLVFVACLLAVIGLCRARKWGFWLATAMLLTNLIGDVVSVVAGTERRAIVGIPIALLLLICLMRKRSRAYFERSVV